MTTPKVEFQLVDFSDKLAAWTIVNDGVMGGRSRSDFKVEHDSGRFSGVVSLENNGGFASVNRRVQISKTLPADYNNRWRINIDIIGDGRTYQLRLRNQAGTTFKADFETQADTPQRLTFSANDFIESFRGRTFPQNPKPQWNDLVSIGFLIADKRAGEFQLTIKAINWSLE